MTAARDFPPAIALASWYRCPRRPVMVLMRRPIGRLIVDRAPGQPVLAWQAELMGAPQRGTFGRSIIVAERPLRLLATLTEPQADAISKRIAIRDFNDALDDLARIAEAGTVPDEAELDRAVLHAATLTVTEHMLERVPSGLALAEIGFRPKSPDATDWYCLIVCGALRARVGARPRSDGAWQLRAAIGEGDARRIVDGHLPYESCRRFVAAQLIELVGLPATEDAVPDRLRSGATYFGLRRDLARLGAAEYGKARSHGLGGEQGARSDHRLP